MKFSGFEQISVSQDAFVMMDPHKCSRAEEVTVFYESGPQSWQKCSTQWFAMPGTFHLAWAGIKPTTYTALSLLFSSASYCQPGWQKALLRGLDPHS